MSLINVVINSANGHQYKFLLHDGFEQTNGNNQWTSARPIGVKFGERGRRVSLIFCQLGNPVQCLTYILFVVKINSNDGFSGLIKYWKRVWPGYRGLSAWRKSSQKVCVSVVDALMPHGSVEHAVVTWRCLRGRCKSCRVHHVQVQ